MHNRQEHISELVEQYVRGVLHGEELSRFKTLLANDSDGSIKESILFHRELQLVATESEALSLEAECHEWIAELENQPKVISLRSRFKKWYYATAIAASIAMVWCAIYFVNLPSQPSTLELAKAHWSNQSKISTTIRGSSTNQAMTLFKNGHYSEANKLLATIPDSSNFFINALLLSGIGHYMLHQTDTAKMLLSRVANQKDNLLSDEAKWRLALVYVMEKEYHRAKKILHELQDIQGYQKKSKEILSNL